MGLVTIMNKDGSNNNNDSDTLNDSYLTYDNINRLAARYLLRALAANAATLASIDSWNNYVEHYGEDKALQALQATIQQQPELALN